MSEEKKPFLEWLQSPKKPEDKGNPPAFRCSNCRTTDIKKQSSMDKTLCDFCWHCMMAAML